MKTLDGDHICDVDDNDVVVVEGDEYILTPIDIDDPKFREAGSDLEAAIIDVRGIKEQADSLQRMLESIEIIEPEDLEKHEALHREVQELGGMTEVFVPEEKVEEFIDFLDFIGDLATVDKEPEEIEDIRPPETCGPEEGDIGWDDPYE